ncbi:MAG: hypothetical protein LBB89_01925 [Treponema sp.]|jgi:uncharacterized protein YbaA (DUF1428 family)|nr:hypothetical protein [Treponema sp.]
MVFTANAEGLVFGFKAAQKEQYVPKKLRNGAILTTKVFGGSALVCCMAGRNPAAQQTSVLAN